MTQNPSSSTSPSLFLYHADPLLAEVIAQNITSYNLNPTLKNIDEISQIPHSDLLGFILPDLSIHITKLLDLFTHSASLPPKIIIIFGVDSLADSTQIAAEKESKINGYINQLIEICQSVQVDIRFVGYTSHFHVDRVGEGTVLNHLLHQFHQSKIPDYLNQSVLLSSTENLATSVLKLWFDRGHRYKTIFLSGQPFTFSSLDLVPNTSQTSYWSMGQGIEFDEKIDVSINMSEFTQFILSQLKKTAPHHEAPPPPKPAHPLPIKTIKSPIIPPPPKPISPTKTIAPPPSQSRISRFSKYIVIGLVSTLLAYLFTTYGLYFFALHRSTRFNPQAGDSLKEYSAQLSSSRSRFQKLSLITGFNPYFDSRYQSAQKHLLISQANHHALNAFNFIIGAKEGDPYKEISQAKLVIDQIYSAESVAVNDSQLIHRLDFIRQLLTLYPQLVPESQKITLLLLFQNNLELRPTGGFIGSVGLLTLDHGKILNFETRSVYDLDSNLRGSVTPPPEVSRYLGESSWYLRDSNWDPNFIGSANSANWFLDKEWGSRADLVVGLSPHSLQPLLQAIGGLTLPNGTAINSDNLLITLLNHQENTTNASNQPEILSTIASSLLNRLAQASDSEKQAFLDGIYQSLDRGDLTLSSSNSNFSPVLDDLRLSGNIYSPPCQPHLPEPCFSDSFYLNQANVGINKANYYVDQTSAHSVTQSGTSFVHRHALSLTNRSPNQTWPAGSYKSYYRAYLPLEASEITLTLDGQPVASPDIFESSPQGKRVVAWFYELKPQTQTEFVITYTLTPKTSLQSYQFFVQKQPGQLNSNFTHTFSVGGLHDTATSPFDHHLIFPIKFSP